MRLVLLGAPGAGKGSQAVKLMEYYNIPHISTGDAFRMNMSQKTEIGLYAKSFIDKGLLVPDEVTIGIVESRLKQDDCKDGFLLDGFPRNIAQAEALSAMYRLDCVIEIDSDFDVVIKRLAGRRSCSCGRVYHASTYQKDTCECGARLYIRDDDREEAIKKRLEIYQQTTSPLIDFYKKQGILLTVDGNCTIDETFKLITAALKK